MASDPGPNYPMPTIDTGPAVPMPTIDTGPAVPMPGVFAEVQPLQAGATAGYIEIFKAVTLDQTAGTTSPDHPITADEHTVRAGATAHVCAVPEECHTCHPRTAAILERERAGRCARCSFPFGSSNPRSGDSPYCTPCVQRCHDSQSVLHLCDICR